MPRGIPSGKIDNNGRECSKCGKYKPWINFHADKKSSSGYVSSCKACNSKIGLKIVKTVEPKPAQLKECIECNAKKPIYAFRPRRDDYGGGHYSTCLDCYAKRKSYVNRQTSNKNLSEEGLDFSKILKYKKKAKNSWTYAEVLTLMKGIIEEVDRGEMKLFEIYQKYAPQRKVSGAHTIKNEITNAIKEAQDKGTAFNLKDYWHGERKFSAKAQQEKVVWKRKKK